MPKFFRLIAGSPNRNWYFTKVAKSSLSEEMISKYIHAAKKPKSKLVLKKEGTKRVNIAFGVGGFFIDDAVLDLFVSNAISGWLPIPVTISNLPVRNVKYHLLGISGRCGRFSGEYEAPDGPFNFKDWDGSDLFAYSNVNWLFMTEKVAQLLTRKKIKGCQLVKVSTSAR